MDANMKQKLREFLKETLEKHGDHKDFADNESLFFSGRLDSFSMMNLVMYLEEAFGLDFSDFEFDVSLVDSAKDIETLINSMKRA
ncbi:MAG: acyl carrier protein [Dechloromonas sp.]|nr:acyl carrier protein [Candidatus Dechloromonas phosphoritropha]